MARAPKARRLPNKSANGAVIHQQRHKDRLVGRHYGGKSLFFALAHRLRLTLWLRRDPRGHDEFSPSLFFLSLSVGLSWNRFLLTFTQRTDVLERQMPITMIASAVCLSALALAIADSGVFLGLVIVAMGLGLAVMLARSSKPGLAVALSVISLAAYLHFGTLAG